MGSASGTLPRAALDNGLRSAGRLVVARFAQINNNLAPSALRAVGRPSVVGTPALDAAPVRRGV